ncbi:MAG TPA: alpha/beta hydrolase [Candidatus Limnocylindrales bacterium]|jgi:pimeloyl-ACP methyl ester carboxylesterase|nr:alpha/beta hydrolase [Candidatus Limnocylindrales bacterium]
MDSAWLEMLGAEVRYYQGPEFRTRALEAGSGEPLLLLHGIGGHAETWIRNVQRLGEHFHVYAIDMLWHGFTSKPLLTDLETIPRFVDHILDFFEAAGIDSAHVEGESLGGWIAMRLALWHPERVRRLVINTTAGWPIDGKPSLPPGLAERSMKAIADVQRDYIKSRMEWLVSQPERMTDEMVDVRYRIWKDPDTRQALENLFRAHLVDGTPKVKFDIQPDEAAQIKPPAMVLWTDKNPGDGPEVGRDIAAHIPGSQFALIEDSGHWPQFEHPEEHDRIVTEFLLGGK